MKNESTTSLLNILGNTSVKEIDSFIENHGTPLPNPHIFSEYLGMHPELSVSGIVKECAPYISRTYCHDLLNGTKTNPSRDKTIILCIACHMDKKMTRRILENYNHRDLYAKDARDIIIATYINNEIFDLDEIDNCLQKHNLEPFAKK